LNISGEIEGKTIAPMLLIPFVENAFKHGNRKTQGPGIVINLDITDDQLSFEITNAIRTNPDAPKDQSGGIGLTNIRRRLNLLYPGKHLLEINPSGGTYQVKLTLWT
jgi:LytS/YehU family sensor histidine kinase